MPRSHDGQAIITYRRAGTELLRLCPEMMKRNTLELAASFAKRMHIRAAWADPADKLDTDFVGGVSPAHKIIFIDTEHMIERAQMRNSCLTHAHSANLFGFDQADITGAFFEGFGQRRSRHPACSTASDN